MEAKQAWVSNVVPAHSSRMGVEEEYLSSLIPLECLENLLFNSHIACGVGITMAWLRSFEGGHDDAH